MCCRCLYRESRIENRDTAHIRSVCPLLGSQIVHCSVHPVYVSLSLIDRYFVSALSYLKRLHKLLFFFHLFVGCHTICSLCVCSVLDFIQIHYFCCFCCLFFCFYMHNSSLFVARAWQPQTNYTYSAQFILIYSKSHKNRHNNKYLWKRQKKIVRKIEKTREFAYRTKLKHIWCPCVLG